MRYFDKAFFRFLIVFLFIIAISVTVISYVRAQTLININTASLIQLDTLPGVGPATALSIIDNRPYAAASEISRADGIGEPGSSSYENIINLITVGVTSPAPEVETPSSVANSSSSSGDDQVSSAPIYSELKTTEKSIKINIGKDRTGSVGSPIFFKAEVNLLIQNGEFRWNFGDGSVGYGKEAIHVYEYPGEYVVVMTLGSMGGESVRINVKVIDPEFSIVIATPEVIEIKNNSKHEASLSGRLVAVGEIYFAFPHDTFVKPGASIFFSSAVTGLFPRDASSVSLITVGHVEQPKLMAKIEQEKLKQIASIQGKIASLEEQVLARAVPAKTPTNRKEPLVARTVLAPEETQAALTIEAVENIEPKESKAGWFEKIKRFLLGSR